MVGYLIVLIVLITGMYVLTGNFDNNSKSSLLKTHINCGANKKNNPITIDLNRRNTHALSE